MAPLRTGDAMREKLVGAERPLYRYTFYVTGARAFPLDMLRYDNCHPITAQDAATMALDDERRIVGLVGYSSPTPERWSSFGWRVSHDRGGVK